MHILVIGRQDCYECNKCKEQLKQVGQDFTFLDVDGNLDEMQQQKIQRASAAGFRNLPIIEVFGDKAEPTFITQSELNTLLKGQN
jgi:glutaredoxin